ncbi:YfhO family protein [Fructobacillus sp. M158]|uniref:YfhO family protein n=1 Tax=Fructobacillus parabroussonetiae TaxID=2713174 RepID=UPI00200B3705|nr:YfhO family protein [Fructobacillus parabroussonetiae]MCK8617829.1 YfhO family protein [Fructobacillus parabroussonetiae]
MMNPKKHFKNFTYSPVALSFWLPFFFLLTYFIYHHMAPFGSSTILTVDLGQQYLDYFAQFKETILKDPSAFFYSFSSGLGGDMLGEWSYYLMSPFNLFFLFANASSLPAWILFVTLAKVATAGLTMALFLKKVLHFRGYAITLFAINYPLSAWFIDNALNLLWLDSAILLPLLLWSLHHLIRQHKSWPFLLLLSLTILSNYYIAWMIALFLLLYLPLAISMEKAWSTCWSLAAKLLPATFLAILLTAWLWLPTLVQLQQGKTTHGANWTFGFENNPALLFFKLIPGSFDFDQMQTGQANFLVAPLILFFLWAFFSSKKIHWLEKSLATFALMILFLATTWTPLILLFHGGQYPVWYPARFSFLLSFLLILMAARAYQKSEAEENWLPSIPARTFFLIATVTITVLGSMAINHISYLDKPGLLIFLFDSLFILLVLLLVQGRFRQPLLFALTGFFLFCNLALSLNNLSYLSQREYQSGARRVVQAGKALKKDQSWYRLAEGLGRTYNDGFLGHFKSGSHFSSLLPAQSASFYQSMGQIAGDSKISYSDGSIVLDSLLSYKYYLSQSQDQSAKQTTNLKKSNRPDYASAKTFASGNGWVIKENQQALPLAYAASDLAEKTPIGPRYPLANQERMLTYLAGKPDQILLTQAPLTLAATHNLEPMTRITGGVMTPVNRKDGTSLVLTYKAQANQSYYLNLGAALDLSDVTIQQNGHKLKQESGYSHSVALNVANGQEGEEQQVIITLAPGVKSRYLDDLALYAFDQKQVQDDLNQLRQHSLKISKRNARRIEGQITTTKDQPLIMTAIPAAPGWSASVDGHPAKTTTIAGGLLAVKTTTGQHHLVLTYTPPRLILGLWMTLAVLIGFLLYLIIKRIFSLAPKLRP